MDSLAPVVAVGGTDAAVLRAVKASARRAPFAQEHSQEIQE
jgi:hypothetical protein